MECVGSIFSPPSPRASRPTYDECDLFLWVLRLKGILLNGPPSRPHSCGSSFGITTSPNPAGSFLSSQFATPIYWVIFPWALSRGTPWMYPTSGWILWKLIFSCSADGWSTWIWLSTRVPFSVSFPWIIQVLDPGLVCLLSPVVKCTVAPEFACAHGITSEELSSESICCLG